MRINGPSGNTYGVFFGCGFAIELLEKKSNWEKQKHEIRATTTLPKILLHIEINPIIIIIITCSCYKNIIF